MQRNPDTLLSIIETFDDRMFVCGEFDELVAVADYRSVISAKIVTCSSILSNLISLIGPIKGLPTYAAGAYAS